MKFSFTMLFLIFNSLISSCFAQKIYIIKVGERSMEVASDDLPFGYGAGVGGKLITWERAMTMCEEKGNGWRLPTLIELRAIYMQVHKTGEDHFESNWYWSGTKNDDNDAWGFHFEYGIANNQYYDFKRSMKYGRAVRDLP